MDYKGMVKDILRENGRSGVWFSDETGMSYSYYKDSVKRSGLVSRFWVRCFVLGYEMGKKFASKASP